MCPPRADPPEDRPLADKSNSREGNSPYHLFLVLLHNLELCSGRNSISPTIQDCLDTLQSEHPAPTREASSLPSGGVCSDHSRVFTGVRHIRVCSRDHLSYPTRHKLAHPQ